MKVAAKGEESNEKVREEGDYLLENLHPLQLRSAWAGLRADVQVEWRW